MSILQVADVPQISQALAEASSRLVLEYPAAADNGMSRLQWQHAKRKWQ